MLIVQAFGVCQKYDKYNVAAVLEWVISFIFFFYVLSFFIDFMPAVRSRRHGQSKATEMEVADAEAAQGGDVAGRYYGINSPTNGQMHGNAATNGYANGYTNGHALNGTAKPAPAHY
jgi:hypothetical protein